MSKLIRFARALLSLLNLKTWGVFTETYEQTKFNAAFSISYSQGAEDISLLLTALADWRLSKTEEKTYIDVGAHDPNRFSVTRRLYDIGWHGVNIDANKDLASKFLKWRKRDIFIWSAVGKEPEYTFYTFEETAISTSNPDWKDGAILSGNKLSREEKVPGRTLRSILDEHFPQGVALLNIDIEGSDEDALKSLELENLTYAQKPKWILLETSPPVGAALEYPAVLYSISNGYTPWLVLAMGTLLRLDGN
jgi:FkbM family methyltransferase